MALKETPKIIKRLNAAGILILMVGMCGMINSAMLHYWFVLAFWSVVFFIGVFMSLILVPCRYPEKLFGFNLWDVGQPVLISLVFLVSYTSVSDRCNVQPTISAWKLVAGFWVVWIVTTLLIRLGMRVGSKISGKRQLFT